MMLQILFFLFPAGRAISCPSVVCKDFGTESSECLQAGSTYNIQDCADPDYTCPHPSNIVSGANLQCELWVDKRLWESDSREDLYNYETLTDREECDPYELTSVCDAAQNLLCYCPEGTCYCEKGLLEGKNCQGSDIPCVSGYACSNSKCTLMYSLEAGEESTNELVCRTGGPLIPGESSFICKEGITTPGGVPKTCSSDNDCTASDGATAAHCQCGMNSEGASYCELHYSDEPLEKLRAASRDKDYQQELYWDFVSTNWVYLQGEVPTCLGNVWKDYGAHSESERSSSSATSLFSSSILLLIIAT